jgi:chloride channel protein, CIC family
MTVPTSPKPEVAGELITKRGPVLILALLSVIAGAAAGLLGAVFRLALGRADRLRDSMIVWLHVEGIAGFLAVILISAFATACAAWLVRRFSPQATGSGIPHVEAQLHGRWSGNPLCILPVKFIGGLLAIGTGLALGREGPSVQMGASIAQLIGKMARCNEEQCKALLAAGAGAGLATAFNAPIAGAVFVLEELVRSFNLQITIATLGASASAIGAARFLVGQRPDFHVAAMSYPGLGTLPIHLVLGMAAGVLGVAYNCAILGALRVTDRFCRYPVEFPAAAIGGAVGLFAWYAPGLVGGGDAITQQMVGGTAAVFTFGLVFVFFFRFSLGAVSYAARTPGGLFAPMLVLGSQSGLLFGALCSRWFPSAGTNPNEYAIVGMAALFAAVVRAPLTGIVLAIELTGSFTLLLPMLGACFTAILIPTLLRNPPIYDSLRPPIGHAAGEHFVMSRPVFPLSRVRQYISRLSNNKSA